jgi:hypothetical protein
MAIRTDKELIDYLEKWGGDFPLRDDIRKIEVWRYGKKIDKGTGLQKGFTVVFDRMRFWTKNNKMRLWTEDNKSVRTGNLREALNAAIEFREDMNKPVLIVDVLKDLQEYAEERRESDEEWRKEQKKEDPNWKEKSGTYSDEGVVLKVKALFKAGKYRESAKAAYDCDTFVREGFPNSFRRFLYQHKIIR